MAATPDAAIADDVDLAAHGISDFGYLVKWGARTVQLPSAMVGYHDGGRANTNGALRIICGHDAFQAKLATPIGADLIVCWVGVRFPFNTGLAWLSV